MRENAIYLPLSKAEKNTLESAAKSAQMSQREYLRSLLWTLEGFKTATIGNKKSDPEGAAQAMPQGSVIVRG